MADFFRCRQPTIRTRFPASIAILIGVLFLHGLFCPPADAGERIRKWNSQIFLQPDHTLIVKERLHISTDGTSIRHGIYRDIPLQGNCQPKDTLRKIRIVSVKRDARDETYRSVRHENRQRIWIGDPQITIEPGEHVWELTYRIGPVLSTFGDRVQLCWPVTGTEWNWPIDVAIASLELLPTMPTAAVHIQGYAGYAPAQGRAAMTHPPSDARPLAMVQAQNLLPGQGLWLEASWPAAIMPPAPARAQTLVWLDNLAALWQRIANLPISWLASLLLGLFALYGLFRGWHLLHNPWPRERTPLSHPPDISPACLRWLFQRRSDSRIPIVALLDMALRGYLRIEKNDKGYRLTQTGKPLRVLPRDEQAMARVLFAHTDTCQFPEQKSGNRLAMATIALDRHLERHCVKRYLRSNIRLTLGGWLFCILAVAGLTLFTLNDGDASEAVSYAMLSGMTVTWSVLISYTFIAIYNDRIRRKKGFQKFLTALVLFAILAILLPPHGLLGFASMEAPGGIQAWTALTGMGCVLALYMRFWTTPTKAGMKVLREVAAYQRYLRSLRDRPVDPGLLRNHLAYVAALEMEWIWNRSPLIGQHQNEDAQQTLDWIQELLDKNLICHFTDDFHRHYQRHSSLRHRGHSHRSSSRFSSGGGSTGGSSGGGGGGW